jgi:formamidopyrimidine-DNA glycosylase
MRARPRAASDGSARSAFAAFVSTGTRAWHDPDVPELPEVEAWRRQLDPLVRRSPIEKAGPAHIATLKTFEPPLSALDGDGLSGVERRAKRFLLPTTDGELVLMVHLMSAGRLKYVAAGGKGAKAPIFRVRFVDGAELQLTEAGSKKRAGVWLLRPDVLRDELAHLGPEADALDTEDVARILKSDSRRLHSMLRDQRLIAGIGRAWANEILWTARLSPFALSTQTADDEVESLSSAIRAEMERGMKLRLEGANDETTYRVHRRLGKPCLRCGNAIAQVDFDEHTIFYCSECQTDGRVLKDRRMSRLLK